MVIMPDRMFKLDDKMNDLTAFRKEYHADKLSENNMIPNPLEQFNRWMEDAVQFQLVEPNAMTLATATAEGKPSARVVLLKEVNRHGFIFFTNYTSKKGRELLGNPFAALVFDWHEMERQVRVEGRVEKIPAADSDAYFAVRPQSSQIGAWASPQSKLLKDREELETMEKEIRTRFQDLPIPRPGHWGGFLIRPSVIEFWQGRPNRLHDRIVYYHTEEGWSMHRLAP